MAKQDKPEKPESGKMYDPNDLCIIGVDTKDPDHVLRDKTRTDKSLNEATVQTMLNFGVIQSVLVRNVGGTLQVIDGRRRVLHAREASKRSVAAGGKVIKVPIKLQGASEDKLAFALSVVANEHRDEDDTLVKISKAEKMRNLGWGEDEIASAFKVGVQTIDLWRALGEAIPAIRTAVQMGKITTTAAIEIAKLPDTEQGIALDKVLLEAPNGRSTVRVAQQVAREIRHQQPITPGASNEDRTVYTPPKKPTVKKVVAAYKEAKDAKEGVRIDPQAIAMAKWILGLGPSRTVVGLNEMLKGIQGYIEDPETKGGK